jgi:16S rRNA (guanine527-N7)-methyltransferase
MRAKNTQPSIDQNVSRETFSPYVALLLKWNAAINLIGPATEADIWSRHIDDSRQLLSLIPDVATHLVDLGSGAGLPGMVIALARPELSVTLVEQDQRKAAFLTEARHRLGLTNVTVKAVDIAHMDGVYDVVTARALAPLAMLLGMAQPLMGEGAICLFPKGKNHSIELAEAAEYWAFQSTLKQSATDGLASIVTISKLMKKHTKN